MNPVIAKDFMILSLYFYAYISAQVSATNTQALVLVIANFIPENILLRRTFFL
jgi:hypothetical protein